MPNDLRDTLQRHLAGNYTVERELGGGGMSRVFLATETRLGRKVVIKVLAPEVAAEISTQRFEREIQTAASLQQANIVPVLTAGDAGGVPFFTMPFVEGESLRAHLARSGPLGITQATHVMSDVARALAYAHEHGIVHRDIKPDNVLLSRGTAVVTDFGIAKAIVAARTDGDDSVPTLTQLGSTLGTPAYMAPEQAAGDPSTDHRADIYAFGCTAYELLTGRPPFIEKSPQRLLAAHMAETPTPVERLRPDTPQMIAALIGRCLEKEPDRRPNSADELLETLDAMATTRASNSSPTIASKQPGTSPRVMKIASALIFLAVALVSIFAMVRSRQNAAHLQDEPRLAVLPFENGGALADAYFVDGMTEAITNRLASISGLSVIGRQSARRYVGSDKTPQQIGSELGVNYLLTGSVRWDKSDPGRNVVSIRPALVRVVDGTQVWAEPYEAVLAGEFKLQSDVAERVAHALDVNLLPHETRALATKPTNDPAAYDDYLRARYFWNKRTGADISRAIEYLRHAIERDPQFARAYAALAEAHAVLPDYSEAEVASNYRLARSYAAKAIALDSTLGGPHATLAALFNKQHHWQEAEREFQSAISHEPDYPTTHHWYALMLADIGKPTEAVAEVKTAQSLDPLSIIITLNVAITQVIAHDYPAAEAAAKSAILLDPANAISYWTLGVVLGAEGRYREAIAELDTAIARVDDELAKATCANIRAYMMAKVGDTLAARTQLAAAKRVSRIDWVGSDVALLHLALSERDSALVWARRYASTTGDFLVLRLPFYDPLKTDLRFVALLQNPPKL